VILIHFSIVGQRRGAIADPFTAVKNIGQISYLSPQIIGNEQKEKQTKERSTVIHVGLVIGVTNLSELVLQGTIKTLKSRNKKCKNSAHFIELPEVS
jgi:hypothetical protein